MSAPVLTVIGLAIIDEIRFDNGTIVNDVLGGSGTFCTIGARLFAPGPKAHSIAWLIRTGYDFPDELADQIETWGIKSFILKYTDMLTPRALVTYTDSTFGARKHHYKTLVFETLPIHFVKIPEMLTSQYFHMFCHIDQIATRVHDLLHFRRMRGITQRPCIVWEANTVSYSSEHFNKCLEAVRSVDVFSPNHIELLALYDLSEKDFDKDMIEVLATKFIEAGIGPTGEGVVVVRAAQYGCLVISTGIPATWLPAFYPPGHGKVTDTTGAGNSFLGGLIMGHSETGDFVKAALHGAIAASFLVEQHGVPKLESKTTGDGEKELWNGVDPRERLAEYQRRIES